MSVRRTPLVWIASVVYLAVTAATLAAPAPALQAPVDARARVDKVFERWATTESPGCAVGVALAGSPVLTRAYGMADLEQQRPNDVDTIFEAGSVSKQFTAAAVLLLAQEGKLSLDDPARQYFKELPDYGAPLTVRHLLTHTSGLRDWGSIVGVAGWPRGSRAHTQAHVLDVLSRQRSLNYAPGARFSYTNSGYNLAAMLVARVSGESFSEFTRKRIFEPLGMTRTSWRDDYTRIVKGRATAYSRGRDDWRIEMPFENVHGNGGLLTTVGDLLRWNENFAHRRVGGDALFEAQHRQALLNDGTKIRYSAGLYVDTWRGVPVVSHDGATAGYRASLARFPDAGLSLAVLCNAANAGAPDLLRRVAEVYLGDRLAPAPTPPDLTLPQDVLAARAGLYVDELTHGTLRLVVADGKLRVEDGPALAAGSPTRFALGAAATPVEFILGADARVTSMQIASQDGAASVWKRVEPATPSAAQLAVYAGRYRSDEAETELEIAVQEGGLVLKQRPDTIRKLKPTYADAFTGGPELLFRRDARGRISELTLSAGRLYDLRFARVEPGGRR